jgi:hypothetical protein
MRLRPAAEMLPARLRSRRLSRSSAWPPSVEFAGSQLRQVSASSFTQFSHQFSTLGQFNAIGEALSEPYDIQSHDIDLQSKERKVRSDRAA